MKFTLKKDQIGMLKAFLNPIANATQVLCYTQGGQVKLFFEDANLKGEVVIGPMEADGSSFALSIPVLSKILGTADCDVFFDVRGSELLQLNIGGTDFNLSLKPEEYDLSHAPTPDVFSKVESPRWKELVAQMAVDKSGSFALEVMEVGPKIKWGVNNHSVFLLAPELVNLGPIVVVPAFYRAMSAAAKLKNSDVVVYTDLAREKLAIQTETMVFWSPVIDDKSFPVELSTKDEDKVAHFAVKDQLMLDRIEKIADRLTIALADSDRVLCELMVEEKKLKILVKDDFNRSSWDTIDVEVYSGAGTVVRCILSAFLCAFKKRPVTPIEIVVMKQAYLVKDADLTDCIFRQA